MQRRVQNTYGFDNHSLDTRFLTLLLYLLRWLEAVEVVDCYIGTFFCKSRGQQGAKSTVQWSVMKMFHFKIECVDNNDRLCVLVWKIRTLSHR